MPIYVWRDKKTGREVDVLRSFDDYLVPPTPEEVGEGEFEWEKINTAPSFVRGPGWRGSKGNWN